MSPTPKSKLAFISRAVKGSFARSLFINVSSSSSPTGSGGMWLVRPHLRMFGWVCTHFPKLASSMLLGNTHSSLSFVSTSCSFVSSTIFWTPSGWSVTLCVIRVIWHLRRWASEPLNLGFVMTSALRSPVNNFLIILLVLSWSGVMSGSSCHSSSKLLVTK